jgi:alanyl-tRNA synthetase
MTGDEIRKSFLRFFGEKGHKVVPGSSLIPHGDPTLLLTSAGMVQFKPYFLGEAVPPSPRLASCQKCFRVTDIDSVGDTTHLTFFEMLGNFSIGDYFKKEAIGWAWEFVTGHLGLPKGRLWITVYLDDDEAFAIWRGLGISADRILKLGEEDNFWGPAGDSGPCGPCSEIHYDFGLEAGCGKPACAPGCGCGRFSEIWNLVFVQYNQDREGKRTPLPRCHIDTGMGLERTAAVVQGRTSVYETDLLAPLVERVSELAGKSYGDDRDSDNAIRIVAEHSRGIAFLIADGVLPDNEGRGYVLRRLLRRAAFFSEMLGAGKPFIVETAKTTIEHMKHVYPELVTKQKNILEAIASELESFRKTLPVGKAILQQTLIKMREELVDYFPKFEKAFMEAISKRRIEGSGSLTSGIRDAILDFRRDCPTWWHMLHVGGRDVINDTLRPIDDGLKDLEQAISKYTGVEPHAFRALKVELGIIFKNIETSIQEVVKEISGLEVFILYDTYGFPVDLTREVARKQGFSVDMAGFEKEMQKQRERAKSAHKFSTSIGLDIILGGPTSEFKGYKTLCCQTKIKQIYIGNKPTTTATEGQEAEVYLEETPFYGEKGGQVGDTGNIIGNRGKFEVNDTTSPSEKEFVHRGHVVSGTVSVGDEVEAIVDKERRLDIARNHTATHLLQYTLRKVLGELVHQRGSLVAPHRLRFDFSHSTSMTEAEIDKVQSIVNNEIRRNHKVYPDNMPFNQAIAEGAIALFDEKYGEEVRVLKIGEPVVSAELCGGTHVSATGEIGFFCILSESSIGGGLRRIEAVTGRGAEKALRDNIDSLKNEALAVQAELEQERKRAQALENKLARVEAETLLGCVEVVNGVRLLASRVSTSRIETMREMADLLRDKLGSGIVVLGAIAEDRPSFIVAVTPDLVKKGYHAGNIVKRMAEVAGGGGGGKPALAQGGGKDKDKLDEALRLVRSLV